MNCLGGLQTLRWTAAEDGSEYEDPNENQPLIHEFIPWGVLWTNSQMKTTFDKVHPIQQSIAKG